MKKSGLLILLALVLFSCKGKKIKLSDGDTVTVSEFIEFFPRVSLPFKVNNTLVSKKESDSSSISYKIFTQFVPDTVLGRQFGKKVQPLVYALGKSVVKDNETYLFIKAVAEKKKGAYMLVFDNNKKFVAAIPLVVLSGQAVAQSAEMDSKYTLTITDSRINTEGKLSYKKNAYVYNTSAGLFTLIMTESNDVVNTEPEVINPIDTLPKKNKLSGDYVVNARNYVSVRDGRRSGTILFFIHFEKDKGTCKGELKGEAALSGAGKAIFRQSSGPCMIVFTFTAGKLTIKEAGPCGTFRDIKCFFEGSFVKKKMKKKTKK